MNTQYNGGSNRGKVDAKGRSSGKITGRDRDVMKPPEDESWAPITRDLLKTFSTLSRAARRYLDFLMIEHMNHAALMNGKLIATETQLLEFGLRKASQPTALKELKKAGLVKRKTFGLRRAAWHTLTFYHTHDFAPATHLWKARVPGSPEGY